MNYTPEMSKAIKQVKKPVDRASALVLKFETQFGVTPKQPASEFSPKERMMINSYLFELQRVLESFGVECRVFGFDDIKG